jgi:hypothetical protein
MYSGDLVLLVSCTGLILARGDQAWQISITSFHGWADPLARFA